MAVATAAAPLEVGVDAADRGDGAAEGSRRVAMACTMASMSSGMLSEPACVYCE